MLNYNIISILLGNDNNSLYGIKNDLLIIYNLFYKFHKNYIDIGNYNWYEPNIFINNKVKIKNIIDLIQEYRHIENLIIIIYFSGHSNTKGSLKFYDEFINANYIINSININLYKKTQIYFIIDSCFSKNFIVNDIHNYKNIIKISYLVSCLENEYSKEIEIDYDETLFTYKKPSSLKLIASIFTFYYIKLLYRRNITNINDFKKIINDKLWKMISTNYNQTLYYEEINQ
jgi:hypothetical protein